MWEPIKTAPKDGTKIDLWAKIWNPSTDSFSYDRFPGCYWMKEDSLTGRKPYWVNLNNSYCPTHWMQIVEGPKP